MIAKLKMLLQMYADIWHQKDLGRADYQFDSSKEAFEEYFKKEIDGRQLQELE